jgi:hypothetical protein
LAVIDLVWLWQGWNCATNCGDVTARPLSFAKRRAARG